MKSLFLTLLLTMGTYSHWVGHDDETFLITCLKSRHRDAHRTSFITTPKERIRCDRFMNSVIRNPPQRSPPSRSADPFTEPGTFHYFASLIRWRNGHERLTENILDHVSPCWIHDKDLRYTWERQYDKQLKALTLMPKEKSKNWITERYSGTISYNPIQNRNPRNRIVSAELIVARKSPSEINEQLGRYITKVYVVDRNGDQTVVHSGHQSSCPTTKGNYFVLNLNLSLLRTWYSEGTEGLNFKIKIVPVRQYTNTGYANTETKIVDVVKSIVGLALHYTPSKTDEPTRPPMANLVDEMSNDEMTDEVEYDGDSGGRLVVRQSYRAKRSDAAVARRERARRRQLMATSCKIISFDMPYQLINISNMIYPFYGSEMLDVKECAGRCSRPFPNHVNVTNHAILVSKGQSRSSPHLTVCCVPVEYSTMHYLVSDKEGGMKSEAYDDMIANKCGCR